MTESDAAQLIKEMRGLLLLQPGGVLTVSIDDARTLLGEFDRLYASAVDPKIGELEKLRQVLKAFFRAAITPPCEWAIRQLNRLLRSRP